MICFVFSGLAAQRISRGKLYGCEVYEFGSYYDCNRPLLILGSTDSAKMANDGGMMVIDSRDSIGYPLGYATIAHSLVTNIAGLEAVYVPIEGKFGTCIYSNLKT